MENFDLMARSYDTDIRVERSKAIADAVRSCVVEGHKKTAMEYGCGTGLVGIQLINDFNSILFVDSSSEMIAQVEKKLNALENSACSALYGDFTKTVPSGLKVDYIFSSLVLHHIANTEAILSNWFELLNNGGHLLIVDLDKDDGSFHAKHPDFDGHNGFEQEKLAEIAKSVGFVNVVAKTFYHDIKVINDRGNPYSLFIMDAEKNTL